ncbi:unnamed protein product [Merluccius merluccius]
MAGLRAALCAASCVLMMGSGCLLWSLLAPGEDRRREILKNLPEANPLRLEETRKRTALMMQVLKEAAETDANVARGFSGGAGK